MQFFDQVEIYIASWKWWDGCVTWRREAGVPFWWPSGWNGWRGWSVILVWNQHLNTLQAFKFKKEFVADDGEPGRSKDQYGAWAQDLVLELPLGTLIKSQWSDTVLGQIVTHGQRIELLQGWRGGVGNMHFKNSTNQYPTFALTWEPGHALSLQLELQLLADVWLIWTPSVWKSTLINHIAHTKAQVAEYHFTTLVPNLWVVHTKNGGFTIIDIPGLIAWAHSWKWLWNTFLRHVLKAKVFALLADCSRFEDSFSELTSVLQEIVLYIQQEFSHKTIWDVHTWDIVCRFVAQNTSIETAQKNTDKKILVMQVISLTKDGPNLDQQSETILFEKVLVIVVSKIDLLFDKEILQEYTTQLIDHVLAYFETNNASTHAKKAAKWFEISPQLLLDQTFLLSAATAEGVDVWLDYLTTMLHTVTVQHLAWESLLEETPQYEILNKHKDYVRDCTKDHIETLIHNWYIQEATAKYVKIRYVADPEFTRLVFMLPRWNDEAQQWFWKTVDKQWHIRVFEKMWIRFWDILCVKSFYSWYPDKYIMYQK